MPYKACSDGILTNPLTGHGKLRGKLSPFEW